MVDHAPQPHLSSEKLADIQRQLDNFEKQKRNKREWVLTWIVILVAISILAWASMPLKTGRGESKASEARASLGTIKDRLRVKFIENKDKTDVSWRLSDLVNETELNGKYYFYADYSLVSLTENTAVFRAAANTNTGSPQVTMTVTNIQTSQATLTSP